MLYFTCSHSIGVFADYYQRYKMYKMYASGKKKQRIRERERQSGQKIAVVDWISRVVLCNSAPVTCFHCYSSSFSSFAWIWIIYDFSWRDFSSVFCIHNLFFFHLLTRAAFFCWFAVCEWEKERHGNALRQILRSSAFIHSLRFFFHSMFAYSVSYNVRLSA